MCRDENSLKRLIEDTFATSDDEIQCEEALAIMARCADALSPDEESQRRYPALWRHFRFCPDCAEEYRLVMHLAQLEADGQLAQPTHVPSPPDEGQPTIRPRAADATTAVFPGGVVSTAEEKDTAVSQDDQWPVRSRQTTGHEEVEDGLPGVEGEEENDASYSGEMHSELEE